MAAKPREQLKISWFENNPNKTVVLVLLTFLVAMTLITEKVLREKLDAKEQGKLVDKFLKELERV